MAPRQKRLLEAIRSSPLWTSNIALTAHADPPEVAGLDVVFYIRSHPDVWPSDHPVTACIRHYLQNVRARFTAPNLAFNEFWYRNFYPEVEDGIRTGRWRSGWDHFLEYGAHHEFDPAFWFNHHWYGKRYPETRQAVKDGSIGSLFEYYLTHGIPQDHSPSLYFNAGWYRAHHLNARTCGARVFPLVHYLLAPRMLKVCPAPFFDAEWYRKRYLKRLSADVDEYIPSPLEHYVLYGRAAGFSPSPAFHEAAYRAAYPDAVASIASGRHATGFEHFIDCGVIDGCIAPTHFETSGVDYTGPEFVDLYERSVRINLRHIARLRDLAGNG